jgi:hypothetical protein
MKDMIHFSFIFLDRRPMYSLGVPKLLDFRRIVGHGIERRPPFLDIRLT